MAGVVGCGGVAMLVLGGTAAVVGGAASEMDANQNGENAVAGEMGKASKDGKFEFTVTDLHCGVDKVGDRYAGATAQGEFCLVNVGVKNVATTAETWDSSSQKAYDAAGVQYSADGGAEIYVNEQGQTFLENINPGNQVKGTLVFDVPRGTKLTSVVLHESHFTAGVRIPVR
ncbi:DUF4352 domain-containing protein [Actinoplanes sp. NPDC051851]|uniref:DUF4352 domain-containing protein n=1 Tax=Actinoplanes sp. NPDC051851 TaxID=3154753 RepID=UPI0034414C2F